MNICPKCGHTKIAGPTYIKKEVMSGTEALCYTCRRCGYTKHAPTLDSLEEGRDFSKHAVGRLKDKVREKNDHA